MSGDPATCLLEIMSDRVGDGRLDESGGVGDDCSLKSENDCLRRVGGVNSACGMGGEEDGNSGLCECGEVGLGVPDTRSLLFSVLPVSKELPAV